MNNNSVNWESNIDKYALALGGFLLIAGISPYSSRGYETIYTDFVTKGSEIILGYNAIQITLMLSGIGIAAFAIYRERNMV